MCRDVALRGIANFVYVEAFRPLNSLIFYLRLFRHHREI